MIIRAVVFNSQTQRQSREPEPKWTDKQMQAPVPDPTKTVIIKPDGKVKVVED